MRHGSPLCLKLVREEMRKPGTIELARMVSSSQRIWRAT